MLLDKEFYLDLELSEFTEHLNSDLNCFKNEDDFELELDSSKEGGRLLKYCTDISDNYVEELRFDFTSKTDLVDQLIEHFN